MFVLQVNNHDDAVSIFYEESNAVSYISKHFVSVETLTNSQEQCAPDTLFQFNSNHIKQRSCSKLFLHTHIPITKVLQGIENKTPFSVAPLAHPLRPISHEIGRFLRKNLDTFVPLSL
jgi:hypothetical protein